MTDCTFKGTAYAAVTPSTLLCLLRVKLCLSENTSEFNNNRQEMFKVKELFSLFFNLAGMRGHLLLNKTSVSGIKLRCLQKNRTSS